jgi:hypothetical protein
VQSSVEHNNKGRSIVIGWLAAICLEFLVLPMAAVADINAGNIAVVEADATILQPGELFDLNNKTLTFTPKPGGGYIVSTGSLNFDFSLGTNLGLGDEDFSLQSLSFAFPFFGASQNSVFIDSNGHVTFGNFTLLVHFNGQSGGSVSAIGEASTVLDAMAGELPRIAVLWQDWNPAAGGGVFAKSLSDRLVVTWNNVRPLGGGSSRRFRSFYPPQVSK